MLPGQEQLAWELWHIDWEAQGKPYPWEETYPPSPIFHQSP